MSSRLSKQGLLARVLAAISAAGWQALVMVPRHPFLLRIFRPEQPAAISARIYIWNCTRGGNKRPVDEYRVQLTGAVPMIHTGETTLLLGWHEDYGVFVGFDIRRHAGQQSSSPSIQVKETALRAAHERTFSAYDRANGEIAVCFRPVFLIDYAIALRVLHGLSGGESTTLGVINELDSTPETDIIEQIDDPARRQVLVNLRRRYREHDFRARVLGAYANRCAFCGLQLGLVEAAHILPVAADGSTDQTANGIALCVLHHRAYDRNLVAINERYQIEISRSACAELRSRHEDGGLPRFRRGLRDVILLPADRRDYPNPDTIAVARRVRGWLG